MTRPSDGLVEGLFSARDAFDEAFAGRSCEVVRADGTSTAIPVHRWVGAASPADLDLFVDACHGPTLDLGCGPGRLTRALADRGLRAFGVDSSPEASRQARERGVDMVCQDLFSPLPGPRKWDHVLLADGNIGLGGAPVRLLRRVAELLAVGGTALVEVGGPRVVSMDQEVRLRVGGRTTPAFAWSTVRVDVIASVAEASGLSVDEVRQSSGRYVATLRHASSSVDSGAHR